MSIIGRMSDEAANALLHGQRTSYRHYGGEVRSVSAIGAELAIRSLDDEQVLGVFHDWFIENVWPEWHGNPYNVRDWTQEIRDKMCADIIAARIGECPSLVGPAPHSLDEVLIETWAGRVCDRSSSVERIMSDVYADCFYAHVLTLGGEIKKIYTGNSEFGGATIIVDASPELLAQYQAELARLEAARIAAERAAHQAALEADRKREAATPRRGKTVKVIRGRKVPVGTVGVVGWYGQTKFGWRVGLDVAGQRLWTDAKNVEVVSEASTPTALQEAS
jgi:hypothetical protein